MTDNRSNPLNNANLPRHHLRCLMTLRIKACRPTRLIVRLGILLAPLSFMCASLLSSQSSYVNNFVPITVGSVWAADLPIPQAAPNAQSMKLNEAGVAQVKTKNFLAAEDSFKRALAIDRSNLTAVYNLAGVYLQNKRTSAAIDLLDAYTKETQTDAGLFSRLGDAYFAAKQIDKAVQNFERGYGIDPNYPQLITKLGTLYSLKKQLKKAEDILRDGAKRTPNDAQLLSNFSSVLYANKKVKEAITYAKRSLQINPTKELYITLGNCYLSLSDKKSAKVALERARDLGDKSPELDKLLKELD